MNEVAAGHITGVGTSECLMSCAACIETSEYITLIEPADIRASASEIAGNCELFIVISPAYINTGSGERS